MTMSDTERGCTNCYYEHFNGNAYPCSRCIYNVPQEDMWQPKRGVDAEALKLELSKAPVWTSLSVEEMIDKIERSRR